MSSSARLDQLRKLQQEDPADAFVAYAIALETAALGDTAKAVAITESLLAQQPDYLGAYYQLGKWLEMLDQVEKAKAVYTSGIALAQLQQKNKTLNELRDALWMLEE